MDGFTECVIFLIQSFLKRNKGRREGFEPREGGYLRNNAYVDVLL